MNILKGVIQIESITDNWKPKLLIVTRNENEQKEIKEVNDFYPYIYVEERDLTQLNDMFKKNIVKIEKSDKEYILDKNKMLYKVTLANIFNVYKIKQVTPCYEADIMFASRYVIDNVDKLESSKYRLAYFDVETTSKEGFPDFMNPVESIISNVSYDSYLNKTFMWIWHQKYKEEVVQQHTDYGELEIRRFDNEINMLNNMIDFYKETSPDIFISYNINFDINYFVARCQKLNLDVQKLSPFYKTQYQDKFYNGLIEWREGQGVFGKMFGISKQIKHVEIKGVIYFDMLSAYKRLAMQEQPSWKLDYVAKKELNMSKLGGHFNIGDTWEKNPEFIEKYNYIDTIILKLLDEKLKILDYYMTIRNMVFLYNITDVFSSGRVLDCYMLKKYKDKYIFPSKEYTEKRKKVGGAFVRQPITGLHKNVAVFDASGCYPNMIKTFNLSSDKLIKEDIINFNTESDEIQDVRNYKEKMYVWDDVNKTVTYKLDTQKFSANLTYKMDEMGVTTKIVDELMNLRKEAKQEVKKYQYGSVEYEQAYKRQESYKGIINAIYGSNAYPGFRLYNNSNANAITCLARMMLKWVSYKLSVNGWKTLGGDTDSLMVQLQGKHENALKEIKEQIQPEIKNAIDEFVRKFLPEEYAVKHTLSMDMEKIYKTFILLDVKKRYIGLLSYFKGKEVEQIHFMGLDAKKSNTIELCKKAQLDLAKCILNEQNYKPIIEKYYKTLMEENDINLFKIPSKLEKNQSEYKALTPAKRATLWSNKNLNTQFRGGMKFYILWVTGIKDIDVIAFEDESELKKLNFKINKEKFIDDLYNKFNNLIRGIPEIHETNERMYQRFKKKNSCLFDFVN